MTFTLDNLEQHNTRKPVDTGKTRCPANSSKAVLIDVCKCVRPVNSSKPVYRADVCKSVGSVDVCKLVCLVNICKPLLVHYWRYVYF